MHIVCTHEQADFDAVASQLGVYLLDRDVLPVLPRRLNRNVRAYVGLYAEVLPFVEFEDLPSGKIERLTLVDTQSIPSVKGAGSETRVQVIDHHPIGPDVPKFDLHVEEVGATSTLLVEQIQALGCDLHPVHSTLLLLGIYEDTGSLTYASTTPRDARAAAWLMECGANLGIAGDFLNHPLSNGQRELYNQLLASVETIDIHGLSILIACGRAGNLVEEISTVAHKLRDVFDPDGLFVIVGLNGSIQLVARSTTEAINVGAVADALGGGGHARAAAALIREKDVDVVRARVIELLHELVEPPVTVGEIMSRDPQLLDPAMPVEAAAEEMFRFGHEGYPVVREGRVVGLLTRRAVDRAMSHGMAGEPIERIMDAGHVVIHAGDSIHQLQREMITHGWGQVPVADDASGEIIGIVTRTDLINTIGMAEEERMGTSLAAHLERALPAPRLGLLQLVIQQADRRGDALYVVGGFVRDLILGQPSVDFDLVVEGDAIGLAQSLAGAYGGRTISHRKFSTAKWELDPDEPRLLQALNLSPADDFGLPRTLDFVTARTEFYPHPTALPSVQRGSIKLDLHRRDFTINTLALRLDGRHYGELLDPWGGGRDLHDGIIRVLHSLSFMDDPTRMLRAVRLEQRLNFQIEPRTLELLHEALPFLDQVSGERVRAELELIVKESERVRIMDRLHQLGLLAAIHPALTWDAWLAGRFEAAAQEQAGPNGMARPEEDEFLFYAMWCFRLAEQEIRSITNRLHFGANDRAHLLETSRLGSFLLGLNGEAAPSQLVARLDESSDRSIFAAWLGLVECPRCREWIENYLASWREIWPETTGETLRDLGLPPGPHYKQMLWRLRAGWLDGEIKDASEEQVRLDRMIEEHHQHG
ncbi:MAG: CBS domain-containing protein [Anaerolineales bacterium]